MNVDAAAERHALSIHVEIHRPVTADRVIVKAHLTKQGRRIVFAAAEMRDQEGTLLAKGTQTAVPLGQS